MATGKDYMVETLLELRLKLDSFLPANDKTIEDIVAYGQEALDNAFEECPWDMESARINRGKARACVFALETIVKYM